MSRRCLKLTLWRSSPRSLEVELGLEERKDQSKIKLKDDWFDREKGKYVSRNVEMTDDCAHTCQLFLETNVREFQEGSVVRGGRCEAMPRD